MAKVTNYIPEPKQEYDVESLKDKKFITKSINHNLFYAKKIKKFLESYNIYTNAVSANFLFLNFEKCKYKGFR